MKKLIAILLLGALLTLSFVGCNVPDENKETTPEVTIESTTPTPQPDLTTPSLPNTTTPPEVTTVTTPPAETSTTPPVETTTPQPETPPPPQLAEDYTEISFNVRLLAQPSSLPVVETFNVKLDNGEISINDILYDEFELISAPEVVFGAELLQSIEQNEKALQVVEQIKNSENCYLLTSSTNSLLAPKLAVYDIDDHCYFISFYENGEVARIHYQSFLFSTALQLNRIFNVLKASSLENSKITYSIVGKDTYYKAKLSGKYDESVWKGNDFCFNVRYNYENATNEEWYQQTSQTDTKALNKAFYDYYFTDISPEKVSFYGPIIFQYKTTLNTLENDYSIIEDLTDLEYITAIHIVFTYGMPLEWYAMG